MADYNAGQAYLTVLPDLSGFGARVREELAKDRTQFKVPVKPEVDKSQAPRDGEEYGGAFGEAARRRIEAALRALPKIPIDGDSTPAERKIDELRTRLEALRDKRIGIDITAEEALAELRNISRELDEVGRKHPDVQVRVDTAEAQAELAALNAEIRGIDGKRVDFDAHVSTGGSVGEVRALMAAGIALGPAIIPVAAAVAAALAAIGTGAVLGAASIGVIILGFHGVGGAVKDLNTVQKESGKTAAQTAATQVSSANSIASAQDGVRNAVRGVADAQRSATLANQQATEQVSNAQRSLQDAYISSSQAIESAIERESRAEQTLASAQQQEQLAQESLTNARQAAQRQIESLTLAVEDGALAERQAQLNIQKAKEELDKTLANPAATQLQREQSQLTYDQSVQQLKDIQVRNRQNAQDKAAADAQGVEGSQQVQAAQRGVTSAAQATKDAQQGLAAAQRGVTEAQRKGAEQVAVAQQNLANAQARQAETARAGAESIQKAQEGVVSSQRALQGALAQQAAQQGVTSASATKLAEDMAKLSPAGQAFVHFVHDNLQPVLKDLQATASEGLLPGVEQGLKNAMPIFPQVKGLVGDLSLEFGSLASRAGAALNDPFWTNWMLWIRGEAVPFTEIFGKTLGNLATAGAALLQDFAPVWDQMGQGLLHWSQNFSNAAQNLRGNPAFQDFMEYVKINGPLVVHFIGDFFEALAHVGAALGPLGHITLEVVDDLLQFINAIPTPQLTFLITALSVGLTAWQAWKIVKSVAGWLGDFSTSATNAGSTVEGWATKVGASEQVAGKLGSTLTKMGQALPFIGAAVVGITALWGAYVTSQDDATAAMLRGGAEAARMKTKLDDELTGFGKWANGFLHFAATGDDATKAMKDQLAAMDPLTRAQTLATQAQNDYLYAVERWGATSPQAIDAQHRYAVATEDTAKQQQILKDGLDKTTFSLKQQQDQLLSASDAEIRWHAALQAATDGVRQNGTTLDLNTEAGRRNQQNVNDLIRAFINEEDTMKKNGATTDQLSAQHNHFRDELINVYTQMGITRDQAQHLTDQYLGIKNIGSINTDFIANTFPAVDAVNRMAGDITNAIKGITDEEIIMRFKADTGNILNNAAGGPIIGKGSGTSDSNLSWVSHGEHVWTASEVQAAGGHGAVYKMRKAALNGYALGGPIKLGSPAVFSSSLGESLTGVVDVVNANVAVVKHIADKTRQQEVAPSSSPGVAHWRPISLQALSIAGQDASNLGRLEMQMASESGGNPKAINRYDINWQHGTPSIGLMQVIGPTYARYRHPNYDLQPHEYGVSEDPLSNILSSIRYTLAAYGSLARGWQGHGYDSGGWLPPGLTMAYNGTGRRERVLTGPQFESLSNAAAQGGSNQPIEIHVHPRAEHSEGEIADMVSRRLSFAMRAAT